MTTEPCDMESHEALASNKSDSTLSPSNWHDVFDQIDRLEQRQSDLRRALWEELLCRLERIERNQAELNDMVLQMKAERPKKGRLPTAKGLALGSPIESVEPRRLVPNVRGPMWAFRRLLDPSPHCPCCPIQPCGQYPMSNLQGHQETRKSLCRNHQRLPLSRRPPASPP